MADPTHVLEFATQLMKIVADDLAEYARDIAILGADPAQAEFVTVYSTLTEASAGWTKLASDLGTVLANHATEEAIAQAAGLVAATHRVARIHGDFKAVEARMHQRFPLFYRRRG